MIRRWLVLILVCCTVPGCLETPSFDDEPTLTFVRFSPQTDGTALLELGFTDGDGNVGLDGNGDTNAPFYTDTDENGEPIKVHYNLLGRFEQRVNGLWQAPELALPFAYQIPKVEPTGSSPSQNGTIEVELTTWRLFGSPADSVRFGWTLWDRDLNPSNEASTGPIAVPD